MLNECRYAECLILFIVMQNVIMVSVVMLSVIMLNVMFYIQVQRLFAACRYSESQGSLCIIHLPLSDNFDKGWSEGQPLTSTRKC